MLRTTVILMALVVMTTAGNAFAWDHTAYAYLSGTTGSINDPHLIVIPYGIYYVAPYQLSCEVNGPWNSGYAFADIWSTADEGETHIDYDDLSANGGEGKRTAGQGKNIDCLGAYHIMINASATIYNAETCDYVEAWSYFSWGGK